MSVIDRAALTIGCWYAPCCICDLREITSAEDLAWVHDPDVPYAGGWATLADALRDLLRDGGSMTPQDLAEDRAYARQQFGAAAMRAAGFES